jgi:hypothetical protein
MTGIVEESVAIVKGTGVPPTSEVPFVWVLGKRVLIHC